MIFLTFLESLIPLKSGVVIGPELSKCVLIFLSSEAVSSAQVVEEGCVIAHFAKELFRKW